MKSLYKKGQYSQFIIRSFCKFYFLKHCPYLWKERIWLMNQLANNRITKWCLRQSRWRSLCRPYPYRTYSHLPKTSFLLIFCWTKWSLGNNAILGKWWFYCFFLSLAIFEPFEMVHFWLSEDQIFFVFFEKNLWCSNKFHSLLKIALVI